MIRGCMRITCKQVNTFRVRNRDNHVKVSQKLKSCSMFSLVLFTPNFSSNARLSTRNLTWMFWNVWEKMFIVNYQNCEQIILGFCVTTTRHSFIHFFLFPKLKFSLLAIRFETIDAIKRKWRWFFVFSCTRRIFTFQKDDSNALLKNGSKSSTAFEILLANIHGKIRA